MVIIQRAAASLLRSASTPITHFTIYTLKFWNFKIYNFNVSTGTLYKV